MGGRVAVRSSRGGPGRPSAPLSVRKRYLELDVPREERATRRPIRNTHSAGWNAMNLEKVAGWLKGRGETRQGRPASHSCDCALATSASCMGWSAPT